MKTLLLVATLVVAGCGSKTKGTEAPGGGASGTSDSSGAMVAGGGAAMTAPAACGGGDALDCGAGAEDGCTDGKTTSHVCVTVDTEVSGPCSDGSAVVNCAAGQYDACTKSLAGNHMCVFDLPAQ